MIFAVKAVEARDLWKISQQNMSQNKQSLVNKDFPETIATHIAMSTSRVPDSIPSNTFKGGFYPHTYTTLNYEEQAEPDTQKLAQNLSPLEFAGLGHMNHAVPPKLQQDMDNLRPHTFSNNLDAVATGRRKWKTSDAIQRKSKVKFQPYTRTSTNLPMFKAAISGATGNRYLLAGRPNQADQITAAVKSIGASNPGPDNDGDGMPDEEQYNSHRLFDDYMRERTEDQYDENGQKKKWYNKKGEEKEWENSMSKSWNRLRAKGHTEDEINDWVSAINERNKHKRGAGYE